jgi:hypothetical protein
MARVRRIHVVVEVEDDDGVVTRHETDGVPIRGTVEAKIIPHYQTRIHRRAGYVDPLGVVDVTVFLDARLDHPIFRVTTLTDAAVESLPEHEVYRIIES